MKKLLVGVSLTAFSVLQLDAGVCTWKGGSGAWNTLANWEEGSVPADGDDVILVSGSEAVTIENDIKGLSLNSLTFTGTVAKASITLTGEAVTLTGSGDAFLSDVPVTNDIPLTVTSSCMFSAAGDCPATFQQPVVLSGKITLKFGKTGYKGNFVFNSTVTGPEATIQDAGSSMYVSFYAPVNLYAIYTATWNNFSPTFYSSGNHWATNWVGRYNYFSAKAENAFPSNMVFLWKEIYYTGDATACRYDFNKDQVCDRIHCPNPPIYKEVFYEYYLVQGTSSAVLTLRGTESARSYAKMTGAFSLVWDPLGDFTQTFAGRANTMSGTLTVRRGTVAIVDNATFLSLTGLVIEDGATLSIAEGSANPFGADLVTFEVRGTGKIVVPDGMELKFRKITASGVPQAANRGFTSESGWIEGAGTVVASETDLVAGSTYWAAPVSGAWTNGAKWTSGVPGAETRAVISATDADYEVLFDAVATVGATTVGNVDGAATLLVTNAADGAAASLTLTDGKALTIDAGGRLELGGSSAIAGATAAANNNGIVAVNRGGTVRTTGGTVTAILKTGTDRAIDMQGGVAEFVDTKVVRLADINKEKSVSLYRYFGSGTMRFDGEAELVYDPGSDKPHTLYTYIRPNNDGEAARLEFCGDSARLLAPGASDPYWAFYVGGKAGRSTLLFDTGTSKTMPRLSNLTSIGYCNGIGELIVKRGQISVGNFTFGIGTPGSDTVDTGLYLSTGIVEVCEGATLTYNGNAGRNLKTQADNYGGTVSHVRAPGLMVGHGLASQNLGAYYRGELRVLGGTLVNSYGSFFVGSGPRGDGEVIQTGGTFESQNVKNDVGTTNEVAIGVFGGTGVYRMSGGDFRTRKNVYVGGATCDDLHRDITNVQVFAGQFHDAKGLVSVSGGTFQTEQSIVLGRDGTGVLELSSTGTVKAAAIVVSNTVGQAASCVKFTSDAKGRFGSIDPATRLSFGDGSKIVIDATDFPADAKRQTLLALENDIAGFDYIKDNVELVNAPQGATADWSEDGRRLRFGCRKGLSVIVR